MQPVLMICFSRSGGTLLSRILGSDENIILISEINSKIGVTPDHKAVSPELALKMQMEKWHGVSLRGETFNDAFNDLLEYCDRHAKQLVLRDWTFIDFYPSCWNNYTPSYRFTTLEKIENIVPIKKMVLVRDAIDVYLSMSVSLNEFSNHYLKYILYVHEKSMPLLKYEDLVNDPKYSLSKLNHEIGKFFSGNIHDYYKNESVTGDSQLGKQSRGVRSKSIALFPRKYISKNLRKKINSNKKLHAANQILNYSMLYESRKFESFCEMILRKLYNKYFKYIPFIL